MPVISVGIDYLKEEIPELREMDREELHYFLQVKLGIKVEGFEEGNVILEITPNRPDLLSRAGIKRALDMYFNGKVREYGLKEGGFFGKVERVPCRPYAVGAVVRGLELEEDDIVDLMQMQEKIHKTMGRNRRLAAIGIHDLNQITFPIRYMGVNDISFIPLGFDEQMHVDELFKSHPKGIEYGHLISKPYPVWVDSNGEVLSLPPIINAAKTAVTEKTKDVFVEVTGIRERVVNEVLNVVVTALAEMGGQIYGLSLGEKVYPDLAWKEIEVGKDYVEKLLGIKLKQNELKALLAKMGIKWEKGLAKIPPYRVDILHKMDVVEDVAIAYGYDNFDPEIPNIFTEGGMSQKEMLKNKIREVLIGFGFLEVITYHFAKKELLDISGLSGLEVKSAKTEYRFLRPSLIPQLLEVLSRNTHYEYPQRIFEVGEIFDGIKERDMVGGAMAGKRADFSDVKGIVEGIFRCFGKEVKIKEGDHPVFLKGRCGEIWVDGKKVGYLGEVHPKILEALKIEVPVACFEWQMGAVDLNKN